MLPETQCNDALVVKGATDFSIAAIMGRQSVCMDSPDKSSSKFFFSIFFFFLTSGFSVSLLVETHYYYNRQVNFPQKNEDEKKKSHESIAYFRRNV